jgi:hypothetical protein
MSHHIYTVDEVASLLPDSQVTIEPKQYSVKQLIREFSVRESEYDLAGYNNEDMKENTLRCSIHIPDHQRFYVWTYEQQNKLIDTILSGYAMPNVIITEAPEIGKGEYWIEDGQQRLTTIWLFCHNVFPYMPNKDVAIFYSNVPKKLPTTCKSVSKQNIFTFAEHFKIQQHTLESFTIFGMLMKDLKDPDVLAEIFERLNSGTKLKDGDKLWNMKSRNLVKNALDIVDGNEFLKSKLLQHFGLKLDRLVNMKNKESLRHLVAIVLTLSVPFENNNTWGDILTISYTKQYPFLDIEVDKERVSFAMETFMCIYDNVAEGKKALNNNTTSVNSSLSRHFGVMLYDWMKSTKEMSFEDMNEFRSVFMERWIHIINHIRNDTHHIDVAEHISSSMYVGKDNKGKNTGVGVYIHNRYSGLFKALDISTE